MTAWLIAAALWLLVSIAAGLIIGRLIYLLNR